MSKEYYRKMIAEKRMQIVSLRASIKRTKENKSARMKDLAARIRNTKIASSKESYRKKKISEAARFDRDVESYKKKIEGVKKEIENYKKRMSLEKN